MSCPKSTYLIAASILALVSCRLASAQFGPQLPSFVSPEVMSDRKVVLRVYAPNAQNVQVMGSDVPGMLQPKPMIKGDKGIWEVTLGPVDPGAYRYNFIVDGAMVLDYNNPSVSESVDNPWSMFYVPGAQFMDTEDVPHGSVEAVTYYSKSLQKFRRLHVYLPPGYESGAQKYPVFYLLHGAGDSDDSWSSVGRAGWILDNLIAAHKVKPMVIVMPAGHTSRRPFANTAPGRPLNFNDDFVRDFENDIMPMAETRYRIQSDRAHRAIAGLSMGGAHTLYIGIANLDKFAYIGVFSSGLLDRFPIRPPVPGSGEAPPPDMTWENTNRAQLENAALKKGLKLFWFSTGSEDFLLQSTRETVDLFKKYGFTPVFHESPGAHTWINWRNYLNEFAPQLFQ